MSAHANAPAIPPAILQRAAEWMARLWSGEASEADHSACVRWRAAHPDHERAWAQLQVFEDKLEHVPRDLARQVLREPAAEVYLKRRRTLQLLGLGLFVGGSAGMLHHSGLWQRQWADVRCATGETRELDLSDGSRLTLGSASAIDLRFSDEERCVVLHEGEVMVHCAADPAPRPRPFRLRGRHGTVEVAASAAGTRFMVRQDAAQSRLSILEGSVTLHLTEAPPLQLEANQASSYTNLRAEAPGPVPPGATAWTRGVLLAENMRVADFLHELSRYRPGLLRHDPAIADLRVSGVFSLRDTDRALHNLALALRLSVSYRTPYWVTVQPRGAA